MDEYEFLTERIAAATTAIQQYEAAEIALMTGGVQSYTIDTGQTKQSVTRANLTEIRKGIDALHNRRAMLIARRDGGGAAYVGGWW